MKKLIIALALVIGISLPFSTQAKSFILNNQEELSSTLNFKSLSHTYELVFKDGRWWIYEYDEDGGLVNTYPADE